MDWRWILMLSGLGVLIGLANILGWIPGGFLISIGLILVAAVLLGYNVRHKLFLHGFLIGAIWGIAGGVLAYLFWDNYLASNPAAAEKLSQVPENMDMRLMTLVTSVFGAAINGAVLGLLALLAGKLLGEKEPPRPEEPTAIEV